MTTQSQWHFTSGELKSSGWELLLDADKPPVTGWAHTGIRIGIVSPGINLDIPADNKERIIFVLAGEGLSITYSSTNDGHSITQELRGRSSVFSGPTDLLYLPINTDISIAGSAKFAIGECPAKNPKPVKYIPKEEVPVAIRGTGSESRQVHGFGMPDNLDADRMIVVEVIVPAGNWSGSPSHKHDVFIPGKESNLEEIYYFESQVTKSYTSPAQASPFGIFRGYSSDEREYDLTTEVRSGDLVLVPHGWHGPVAAGPGYDLYFFNVMAGPDPERTWNVTDEPSQIWIRDFWNEKLPDSRLPYGE